MMKKAVLYVRVSSKEQKEEGFSIPSQKKLLREYAKKNNLNIIKEFEEAETAKKSGRKIFQSLIAYLKKHTDVTEILVEKTDRLYRNFPDYATIDNLERNIHLVKEGQILNKNSKSHEKLVHDIKVVLAKNYVDNLSEETRKGMLEKAEQGLYPSFAPLGYLNNPETKEIDIDFPRARIIRKIFNLYSSGNCSLKQITKIAHEEGLRSRSGKIVPKSAIGKMLQNPIYIGDFVWKGIYYQGKHDPIVPRDLYDRVQSILKSKTQPRGQKREFAFRGMLICGTCGCRITAEIKKGKYVYYRCTKSRGKCHEKPIREEDLARMLGEPLKRLTITDERLAWILKALKESYADEQIYHKKEIKRLETEFKDLEQRISKLYEDKLNEVIPENFWKSKYQEYVSRQGRIQEQIIEHRNANVDYLANGARILELAQKAYSLYVSQDSFEQRKLLDLILSNSTLKDGKVYSELRKPFDTLADGAEKEKQLQAQSLPFEAANNIWLPRLFKSKNF